MLINITGGEDMSLHEVSEAAHIIQEASDTDANIIFGTVIDRAMQGRVKVTVIATGFLREDIRSSVHPSGGARASRSADPEPLQPSSRSIASRSFLRGGSPAEPVPWDTVDEGLTPHFTKLNDELDVPTFLRKQFD